jgi:hypothetical protein
MLATVLTKAERFYKKLLSAKAMQALNRKPEDADFESEEWPARRDDAGGVIAKTASAL